MSLKTYKLLRMTYYDISEFFGLKPDDRRNVWLKKGLAYTKYTAIIKRRSDKWNLEWKAPLSLRRPVIVNICIINASIEEPKCLCYPDWRRSQIFRNSLGRNYPWLNIYICSTLSKRKKKQQTFERKKTHTSINHDPKTK